VSRDDPRQGADVRASASLDRRIEAFRARHPVRTAEIGGVSWSYRRCGTGGPWVLLLTGALGQADFGFPVIEALARHASILAPDYPVLGDMEKLVAGLVGLLDREGAQRVHVVGGSFGGVVAQAFSRERPERVASLVLSHSGAPCRTTGQGTAVAMLWLLPAALLRALMAKRLRPALRGADPFWARAFERSLAALGRRDILSRVALAAEFGRRYGGLAAPAPWPVLVLDSDDDPLFAEADRAALLALYRGAEHRRFRGTGHVTSLLEPEAFASTIADFVRRAEEARR
jgi:pimeloyl-ACP methyl ester carboxylesterase